MIENKADQGQVATDEEIGINVVADNYDNLDTVFGIVVASYESVQSAAEWGSGTAPAETPQNLVASTEASASPHGVLGRIMPGDDTSAFNLTLHAKGTKDDYDQSGDYSLSVVLTVTADEQLNP